VVLTSAGSEAPPFLRAINVAGHASVKMTDLIEVFTAAAAAKV
jgi:uncharacterized protein (DUF1697 family)